MMAGSNNNLSLISYNCQHANELSLPFLQELFENCDFFTFTGAYPFSIKIFLVQ